MPAKNTENLLPVDDQLRINKGFAVPADRQLVDPNNVLCFYDGEWVTLSNGAIVRASNVAVLGNASTSELVHPLFSERGSSDVQAHPDGGLAYILGPYGNRFRTTIYDPAVTVGSGAPISGTYGQGLKVATISLSSPQGTRNFTGLVGHGGSGDSSPVVARVVEVRSGVLTFILGK